MASGNDGIPTSAEVERQLQRILASKRLRVSPNRQMLLEYAVKRHLGKKEITEDIIGYALFPGYAADESDIVRVTASQLRKTLSLYYAGEGIDDLVRIDLPPGPKYRPVFTYNPRSPAHQEYSRGRVMLSETRLQHARESFEKAIELRPDYADPHVGLAELHLLAPMWPNTMLGQGVSAYAYGNFSAAKRLPFARASLATALHLNRGSWRAHLLRGVVHSYERQWTRAEKAFARALALDERATRDDPWYLAFLVARGRQDEVFEAVKARIRDEPTNVILLSLYGILLYLRREFRPAIDAFADVSALDRTYWPSTVAFRCASLDSIGPGIMLMSAHDREFTGQHPFPTCFPGLFVLALARQGKLKEARKKLAQFDRKYEIQPVQLALAYMGLGERDKAVRALARSCDDLDPLMLWLHLWPIFDPLRKRAGFKKIIERIGLPKERALLLP